MMTLIAYVFPKLWTAEGVVRKTPKKPRFRTPFDSQHTKWSQTLLKSALHSTTFIIFSYHSVANTVGKSISW